MSITPAAPPFNWHGFAPSCVRDSQFHLTINRLSPAAFACPVDNF
ncbi:hypothetical protein SCH4B_1931 [Ruegeria sp. TrichCH4B]|nr:hypothetical protein SCH4B_1931 [Ruegeria sp. TrichCH4B]